MVAKLGIVLEEADESAFWLDLLVDSGRANQADVAPLRDECEELIRIIAASIITLRKRLVVREEGTDYLSERRGWDAQYETHDPNPMPAV